MKNFISLLFFIGTLIISPATIYAGTGSTINACTNQPVVINWNIANCSSVVVSQSSGACNLTSPPLSGGAGSSAMPNASTNCSVTITCSSGVTDTATGNVIVDTTKTWSGGVCVAIPTTCNLPWGGTIANGASVSAYSASSVAWNQSCSAVGILETRTCNNGTLSGSFANQSCTVTTPLNCNVAPWGAIAHGASVTAYQSASVMSPAVCASVSESRTCTNGTLSGTYTNQTCSVTSSDCTLPWGGTITTGTNVTAYSSSYIASPGTCASLAETRTCTASVLSGSNTIQTCLEGSASFTSTPACSIANGNAGCNTTLGWTSTDAGTVSLTDCGGGLYGTYPTGARSGPVYVPYNAGCYQIRDSFNTVLATANTVNSNCTVGAIWDPVLSQCRLPIGGTLSANPQVCNISPSSPTCESTFTWTTTNPIGSAGVFGDKEYVGDTRVSESLLTVISPYAQLLPVFFSGQTFRLYNNGEELASTTITQVCMNGGNNPPACTTGSVMNGWLSATPASCVVPTGASACNNDINLTWGVTNPVNYTAITLTPPAGSPEIPVADNNPPGGMNVSVPYRDNGTGGSFPVKYFLYNNIVELGVQTINVSCAAGANKWDTTPALSGGQICADPQVGLAEIVGKFGYSSPSGIRFSCLNSTTYEVIKNPGSSPVTVASGNYTVPVTTPLTETTNYVAICKHGSVSATSNVLLYESASSLPAATVSVNATPKTVDKGGKTTLSWSINHPPLTGCTLTATAVCTNNDCTSDPDAVTAAGILSGVITSGTTDTNDPAGSRLITLAVSDPDTSTFKATGKKTFDIQRSTNFTINCGGTNKASTIVRVTNSNEQ